MGLYDKRGECGRGGIGRRAALRSLSGKPGGSSSLLDRTILLTLYVSQVIDSQALCQSRGLECFISLSLGYAVAIQSVLLSQKLDAHSIGYSPDI